MKSKKAQGLPMNTIVIAAIVLVVLVVLIMIFTGSIGKWRQDIEEKPCTEVGGECQDPPCDIAAGSMPTRGKCDPGKVCCIKTTKDEKTLKEKCEEQYGTWRTAKSCGPNEGELFKDETHVCCST